MLTDQRSDFTSPVFPYNNVPLWVRGSRIGPTFPPACRKRRLNGGSLFVMGGMPLGRNFRVLVAEPTPSCGAVEAIHCFGLSFT